jgi:hypothetical protein
MSADERRWTLETARVVLEDVRRCTERAVRETDLLVLRLEGADEATRAKVETKIQGVVARWAREIEALGAEAKGAWLVDFDNGSGYYCWRWPEEHLGWFHPYDTGFAGRQRIQ